MRNNKNLFHVLFWCALFGAVTPGMAMDAPGESEEKREDVAEVSTLALTPAQEECYITHALTAWGMPITDENQQKTSQNPAARTALLSIGQRIDAGTLRFTPGELGRLMLQLAQPSRGVPAPAASLVDEASEEKEAVARELFAQQKQQETGTFGSGDVVYRLHPKDLEEAETRSSDADMPAALALLGYPGETSPSFRAALSQDDKARIILSQIGYLAKKGLPFEARDVIYSIEIKRVCFDMHASNEPMAFRIGRKTYLSEEGLRIRKELDSYVLTKMVFWLAHQRLAEGSVAEETLTPELVLNRLSPRILENLQLTADGKKVLGTLSYIIGSLKTDHLVPTRLVGQVEEVLTSDMITSTVCHSLLCNKLDLAPKPGTRVTYPEHVLTLEGHNRAQRWLTRGWLGPSAQHTTKVALLKSLLHPEPAAPATVTPNQTQAVAPEATAEQALTLPEALAGPAPSSTNDAGSGQIQHQQQAKTPAPPHVKFYNPAEVTRTISSRRAPRKARMYAELLPPKVQAVPQSQQALGNNVTTQELPQGHPVAKPEEIPWWNLLRRAQHAYRNWRPSKETIETYDLKCNGPHIVTEMDIKVAAARLKREKSTLLLEAPGEGAQVQAYPAQAIALAGLEQSDVLANILRQDKEAQDILELIGYLSLHGGKHFSAPAIALSLSRHCITQEWTPDRKAIDFAAGGKIFRLQNNVITLRGDFDTLVGLLGVKALNPALSGPERLTLFNAAPPEQRQQLQELGTLVAGGQSIAARELALCPAFGALPRSSSPCFEREALREQGPESDGTALTRNPKAVNLNVNQLRSGAAPLHQLPPEFLQLQGMQDTPQATLVQTPQTSVSTAGTATSSAAPQLTTGPEGEPAPSSGRGSSKNWLNPLSVSGGLMTLGGALFLLSHLRKQLPFAGKMMDQLRLGVADEELSSPVGKSIYRAYGPKKAPLVVAFLGMAAGAAMVAYGVRS